MTNNIWTWYNKNCKTLPCLIFASWVLTAAILLFSDSSNCSLPWYEFVSENEYLAYLSSPSSLSSSSYYSYHHIILVRCYLLRNEMKWYLSYENNRLYFNNAWQLTIYINRNCRPPNWRYTFVNHKAWIKRLKCN
jgi:hypothetical protein